MKAIIPVTLIFAIVGGFSALADNSCRGIDLRRPELNRPYTQIYLNTEGKKTDSAQCASFSSTLLTSQQLGISLNPVDGAVQSNLAIHLRDDKNLAALLKTDKHAGYCRQEAVDAYFGKKQNNFEQVFNDFIRSLNPKVDAHGFSGMTDDELQKIAEWLNSICGERIQTPTLAWTIINLKSEYSPKGAPGYMDAAEMGDEIDRLLDSGHFVSYTHAFHAVTIVGRTVDCRYIIQDSIPEAGWNDLGGFKQSLSAPEDEAQIAFENQFFQYWSRDVLLKNAVSIMSVENH